MPTGLYFVLDIFLLHCCQITWLETQSLIMTELTSSLHDVTTELGKVANPSISSQQVSFESSYMTLTQSEQEYHISDLLAL